MRWVFLQREQYARAHEKKKKKKSLRRDVGFEGTLGNELENCIDNVDRHSADWRERVRLDK